MNTNNKNCGCGPEELTPVVRVLDPFNISDIIFNPEPAVFNIPEINVESVSLPQSWFNTIRDSVESEETGFVPDPYDPYNSNDIISLLETNNDRGLGTVSEVLNDIANEYPAIPEEVRQELENAFDDIANSYWDTLSEEEQQAAIDALNAGGGGGGGGGSVGGPGGGISGAAGAAAVGSALASINALFSAILSIVPSISIYLNLDILQPFLAIAAAIRAGVQVLNLFSALVAGVDVKVDLGIKQLIKLLNPLTAANFNPGPLPLKIPIIPQFGLGTGLSVSLNGIRAGINFSAMASVGLSGSLGLSADVAATLSGSPPMNAAEAAIIAEQEGVDISVVLDRQESPPVSGDIAAPGGGVVPGLAGIQALTKNQKPALAEGVEFGSKPTSYEELLKAPIDTTTKLHIVPSVPGSTSSVITFSKICSSGDCIINGSRMKGLRDALNRSKVSEDAVIHMFNKLQLPFQTKITLSELILRIVGWDTNIPIDPMVLNLIALNLTGQVKMNVTYVMMTMAGSEPPDVAVYLS